jgi:molecular chaperone DnaK (HSP70)
MWVFLANFINIFTTFLANGTLTDSCVYYDQDSDVELVGKQAANEKANNPENTICGMKINLIIFTDFSDSKRLMGLPFSEDASICEFQGKMKQFKIVNSGGYAAFELRHCGRTIRQTPIEIAAKILEKIRETADEWANGERKYNKAVITVPLKFGQEQLVGTIRAAKLAGFSEVHLVKEPNAGEQKFQFEFHNFSCILLRLQTSTF